MNLGKLADLYKAGVLNANVDANGIITIGGRQYSNEEIAQLLSGIGWEEYKVSPVEALTITHKFMRDVTATVKDQFYYTNTDVIFRNKVGAEYNKTVDMFLIYCHNRFDYSVIHGMKGNPAPYTIYNRGVAVPVGKARTSKKMLEFVFK